MVHRQTAELQKRYNCSVEVLADGDYQALGGKLIYDIAKLRGFSHEDAAKFRDLLATTVPNHFAQVRDRFNGSLPDKHVGTTFNIKYDPKGGELTVLVRNPVLDYVPDVRQAIIDPLQQQLGVKGTVHQPETREAVIGFRLPRVA